MKIKKTLVWGFFLVFFCSSGVVFAQENYIYAPDEGTEIYFGHISYVDIKNDGMDPVIFGEDLSPEIAVLNFPFGPGDTIRTSAVRRCEIQFDTGTIIRLDYDTELKVETILADSLSKLKNVTNLILVKGQVYVMYNRYSRREIFQIITPSAAVKLNHNSVSLIGTGDDGRSDLQVNEGHVNVIYGPDEKNVSDFKLKKNRKVTISPENKLRPLQKRVDAGFEIWNQDMNQNFMEMHEGLTPLPKPIQKLPKAIFYFAQKYSTTYGEWVWDEMYGYVWRPHFNDVYPWGTWSPYHYGHWHELNGQMFWVPQESWGWVPYHLGLWTWNENKGWLWIPGSAFAPAWATWEFFYGRDFYALNPLYINFFNTIYFTQSFLSPSYFGGSWFGWSPLYMWDYYPGYASFSSGYNSPYRDYILTPPPGKKERDPESGNTPKVRVKDSPAYKLPKNLEKVYAKVVKAIEGNDAKFLSTLEQMPQGRYMVKREDITAPRIHEKIVRADRVLSGSLFRESGLFSRRLAVAVLRQNKQAASKPKKGRMDKVENAIKADSVPLKTSPNFNYPGKDIGKNPSGSIAVRRNVTNRPNAKQPQSDMRFRDWNPDVKAARKAGVSISYSSRTNEVTCLELGMSSRSVRQNRSGGRSGYIGGGSSSSSGFSSGSSSSGGGGSRGSGGAGSRGGSSGGRSGGGSRGGSGGKK